LTAEVIGVQKLNSFARNAFIPTPAQQATYDDNLKEFKKRIGVVVDTLVDEITAGHFPFCIPLVGTGLKDGTEWIVDQIVNGFLGS
jgi:hypothetical protein